MTNTVHVWEGAGDHIFVCEDNFVIKDYFWLGRADTVLEGGDGVTENRRHEERPNLRVGQFLRRSLYLCRSLSYRSLLDCPDLLAKFIFRVPIVLTRTYLGKALIGPEPSLCGIAYSTVRASVSRWVLNEHQKHWEDTDGHRHAKRVLRGP